MIQRKLISKTKTTRVYVYSDGILTVCNKYGQERIEELEK